MQFLLSKKIDIISVAQLQKCKTPEPGKTVSVIINNKEVHQAFLHYVGREYVFYLFISKILLSSKETFQTTQHNLNILLIR